MLTPQNIKDIIAGKSVSQQVELLDGLISRSDSDKEKALILAEKGKLLWKSGDRAGAISAYEQGGALDPGGAAALLLDHSRGIMDFFNPDLLNP
ncbi:MAG: hypothetical protein K2L97_04455 [Muribaculaceae bacterium]|nr:hypothetical protein [Muribaculaceae bacterium]